MKVRESQNFLIRFPPDFRMSHESQSCFTVLWDASQAVEAEQIAREVLALHKTHLAKHRS
jgi:hypothetical protein